MSILVFLFIGMLAVIYAFSYYDTLRENQKMLENHAALYFLGDIPEGADKSDSPYRQNPPDVPDPSAVPGAANVEDSPEYQLSSFYSVAISRDGSILSTDNTKTVYTDEELNEIALKIYRGRKNIGTTGNLIFYKADKGSYTLIAFMDNSLMMNSISTLFQYTLVCGSITILLLFFLARQLAKRIVRPLEESYTKQKQFISDAGHELKTPISVVNTNAELLSREIGDNPWLANIQYENERMGALVTQLLDLTRTENTSPQMETVDFSRLARGEALPFESVAFEKGMTLNFDIKDNIKVCGNTTQLKQIISILLDNAIRHADPESEITIRLKPERNHAALSVVNAGKEIPADQQKQLFERFYRIDTARNSEDEHYGLGLAIAKAIVTAHKGKIDVSCYDGKIEFTVRIPLHK